MSENQRKRCAVIINSAAMAAGGVGVLPVPGPDALVIENIQMKMIQELAELFGNQIDELDVEQEIKQLFVRNSGTLLATNLIKAIPGAGMLIRGIVAAALTETLGWHMAEKFADEDYY